MDKDIKQILVVRKDLNMRKGKIAAQAAHASMKFILDRMKRTGIDPHGRVGHCQFSEDELEWISDAFTKICVSVDSEKELLDLIDKAKASDITVYSIVDCGRTEFHDVPTLTCAAFGPAPAASLFPLTGQLKLL